ncbi:roadblock/LC7 domain-containing protein [Geopsychrobacter electrodiphilus]|uniref:roadblock/LC7 domain-containing protein n=1 Tax=Geopsychrobacter electrodiphilus TaxID=225196 RepID=UPI00036A61FA|nr:roadblock/LC7 domain-containing protein [Geopsychrobacter electrodiphilus]
MATAKDFVMRISSISGVSGCVLVREDGEVLGSSLEDPDLYASLMIPGRNLARDIMGNVGFSHCRYLGFNREGKEHFYLFLIDKFLLGLVQAPDCHVPDMLQAVTRLVGRVTTGGSSVKA